MCLCVCLCLSVHLCLCVCACTHTHVHVYMCVNAHVCMYVINNLHSTEHGVRLNLLPVIVDEDQPASTDSHHPSHAALCDTVTVTQVQVP